LMLRVVISVDCCGWITQRKNGGDRRAAVGLCTALAKGLM
jgi:hypothetical protein